MLTVIPSTTLDRAKSVWNFARYFASCPRFIVVLGMHRSGTSLATRMLNNMGAALGHVYGPAEAPPGAEIHWESSELVWINDEILRRSGGTWSTPPRTLAVSRRDIWRCRQFLWSFAGLPIAAMKDPRLVLTYAVWRSLLPRHTIVACLRHPMNVARSLAKRDGIPISEGLAMWVEYNERLAEIVSGHADVHWFDFDLGEVAIEKLTRQLGAVLPLKAASAARSEYSPEIHRFREAEPLGERIGSLYESLRQRASEA